MSLSEHLAQVYVPFVSLEGEDKVHLESRRKFYRLKSVVCTYKGIENLLPESSEELGAENCMVLVLRFLCRFLPTPCQSL